MPHLHTLQSQLQKELCHRTYVTQICSIDVEAENMSIEDCIKSVQSSGPVRLSCSSLSRKVGAALKIMTAASLYNLSWKI